MRSRTRVSWAEPFAEIGNGLILLVDDNCAKRFEWRTDSASGEIKYKVLAAAKAKSKHREEEGQARGKMEYRMAM